MRRIIVMLLLLAVAVWFAPPQLEDVSGQCQALERRTLRTQLLQTPVGKEDATHAAAVVQRVMQYARSRHGDLPPGLGCGFVYWELVGDSDLGVFQTGDATTR